MGLFKKRIKRVGPSNLDLNEMKDNGLDETEQDLEQTRNEAIPDTTAPKEMEEDNLFFDILDYMTAPERNYLANIQRGSMTKERLFAELRTYLEDIGVNEETIKVEFEKLEKYIWGYYIIEDLINDDNISDIKIYDENNVRIKTFGKRLPGNVKFRDESDYRHFVDIICSRNKVNLSDIEAIQTFTDVDSNEKFRLRFNLTSPIINSSHKPAVHIRKVPKIKKTLVDLANNVDFDGNKDPVFPEELIPILKWMAKEASGIIFTGKGASGKTTLTNAMLEDIPNDQSGLVIQENDELHSRHPDMLFQHVLQSRGESKIKYTLKDLAINGLLTDLDYFIIGEIKGGEAAYFMNAAYTGHKCWADVHGVSSTEAMKKLADYVKYETDYSQDDILKMLCHMRFVIFMKDYHIEEISEVVGFNEERHDLEYKLIYKRGEFFRDPRLTDKE